MSTLRRRILATAALPAAALGFLLAAPAAASASTATPLPSVAVADHEPGHQYHGLHLSILLGLHITGGHHDDDGDCYDGLLGGGLLDLG
ncbi:hypothetical protein Amsp01_105000 [Amycolatopsis sp. NBRC 101858]|uniref:hypothetical protein n=1 Tax=Amycolatopsis sp. NBRC 101858 TaxID=3032200 RepID=UPI0024A2FAB2|nr:hypothetical protein [Amycolatopsis sp. NBRC 101858]GLY44477.1 hypothetical protein Amsp01_105000 [Amycolatopsis sp. NBRC 101858]